MKQNKNFERPSDYLIAAIQYDYKSRGVAYAKQISLGRKASCLFYFGRVLVKDLLYLTLLN
jgi:hypothetical protein